MEMSRSVYAAALLNILTQAVGGRAPIRSEPLGKDGDFMDTYEEFMIILTVALLIVSILDMKNKK